MSRFIATAQAAARLLTEAALGPTLLAYAIYGVCLILAGLRWQYLLRGLGQRVGLGQTTAINVMSILANNLVPGRITGEVFRLAMLRLRAQVAVTPTAASCGYDRVLDLLPIGAMTLLCLPVLWPMIGDALTRASMPALRLFLWGGAVAVGLIFVTWWVARERIRSLPDKLRGLRDQLRRARIKPRDLGLATLVSFAMWFLDVVRYALIARALHVSLSPGKAILLCVVAALAGLLPSIGGVGAIEGGMVVALLQFGVSADRALAIALLERFASYVLLNLGAALLLLLMGGVGVIKALRAHTDPART